MPFENVDAIASAEACPVQFRRAISYRCLGVPAVAAGILAVHGPGPIGAAEYDDAALAPLAVPTLLALLRAERKERKSS